MNATIGNRFDAGGSPLQDLFELRFGERALARAMGGIPDAERAVLLQRVDELARQLDSLIEATHKVRAPLSLDLLLTRLMTLITEAFGAERSSLFLYDADSGELFSRIAQGELVEDIRFPADAGIAGLVFSGGEPAIIHDAYADPRFNSAIDAATGYRTRNILCVPLRARSGDIIGVTEVLNKCHGEFTATDCALLQAFTTHTAMAIETARLGDSARAAQREEAPFSKSRVRSLGTQHRQAAAQDHRDRHRPARGGTQHLVPHDPTPTSCGRASPSLTEREIRIPAHVGIAVSLQLPPRRQYSRCLCRCAFQSGSRSQDRFPDPFDPVRPGPESAGPGHRRGAGSESS